MRIYGFIREENKNFENNIESQQPKEYSNSTYVAANFAHERRNLLDEEPVAIDPEVDNNGEATAFVDIDSASPLKLKQPKVEVKDPPKDPQPQNRLSANVNYGNQS